MNIHSDLDALVLDTPAKLAAARNLLLMNPDSGDVRDALVALDQRATLLAAAPPPPAPADASADDSLTGTPDEAIAAANLAAKLDRDRAAKARTTTAPSQPHR